MPDHLRSKVDDRRLLTPEQQVACFRNAVPISFWGFELESRHADWSSGEFTTASRSQVCTYRRHNRPMATVRSTGAVGTS
jgi:hypothetical protein